MCTSIGEPDPGVLALCVPLLASRSKGFLFDRTTDHSLPVRYFTQQSARSSIWHPFLVSFRVLN